MEDNVKGLIRTCCIVLIISIGLSVVYSAKRPYIYLIDNYDYYNPSATAEGAPHLHQHQQRRSNKNAAGRISVDGGYSGNDYNNKFLHPFIFHDTHRNGEVTEDSSEQQAFTDKPPQRPSLNTKISGSSSSDNGRKRSKKVKNNAGKIQESTGVEQSFPFPIPWDWNVRMAQMKKERKNDEERKFKLPRLPTLPTIEFQFSAETETGRMSRSHIPRRGQNSTSKQIKFADIISPETLSFISKLQMLNVTKLANGGGGIISVGGGSSSGSEEVAYNPSVGTPLLSGDFLNVESSKPLIIGAQKDSASRQPTKEEIDLYHKLKHKFNKPTTAATDKDSDEDDEPEPEDDEAEDDASVADADNSQQQSDEDQEIGSKSKESKESKEDDVDQEPEPERDSEREPEPDQENEQDDEKEQEQSVEKEQEQSSERDPSAEKEHSDEEVLDASDEELALNDNPLTRPKKKTRPTPTRITRPSSTFALDPSAFQGLTRHNTTTSSQSSSNYHQNLFEPAAISSSDPNDATKPVIILLNVPKPTELKGDTGSYDSDYLYGDEQKKAWKKKKIQEKKKKKKKKKAKKKKKKKKKKGGGGGWWPKPTQRPNKKADIINRLTKVHSNVQEIYNVFKGVISDYVVNRPHIGVEFIHTNSKSPPPHRARPPPKEDDDDDDDDEKGDKEKSGEIDVDEHAHDREKSDDRKLRLPGSSSSFEDFEDDQYVAVGGKPTIWNPAEWNYNYPSASDAETATTLSKRFQECQNAGDRECSTTIIDRPMKYNPPEPLYMETVVSSESGEKPPPRPPYREPPPRISTGSSEKVWVKTWDKDKTGLPLPIDSSELNKS